MSKNNNVNPNFYKDGGREHTEGSDKGDPANLAKQQFNEKQAEVKRESERPGKTDPKK